MKYLVMILVLGFFLFVNQAYAMWIALSPQELLNGSKTILVGTVTDVTPTNVEYQSQISSNGTIKQSVGPEVMTLDKYTVSVEEFLKNPQGNDTVTLLQATVGGVPGVPAKISGFEIGDRVLFYLPQSTNQVYFSGEYLPESFKIPPSCDAKTVLEQPRIDGFNSFGITQDGILKQDNFTAGKPIKFVFNKDTGTLFGSSFDVKVAISSVDSNQVVFEKKIHSESNLCQWITSAEWEFTPQEGKYEIYMAYGDGGGTSTSYSGFSVEAPVNSILPRTLIVQNIPGGLPTVFSIKDLEELSKYTLNGTITEIKPVTLQVKPAQSDTQTRSVNEISVKIEDNHFHTDYTIKFLVFRYISSNPASKSDEREQKFQTGDDVSVFLTSKEPESDFTNTYAGFIANKRVISDGFAYDVTSTKQPSPLQQLKSGIHSRYVNCNESLELLIKESTGQPVCVTSNTMLKLIERGWAKSV